MFVEEWVINLKSVFERDFDKANLEYDLVVLRFFMN